MEKRGLPVDDIRWSLSYCQGDGMAFYGDIDLDKFLEFYKLRSAWRILFDSGGNERFNFRLRTNNFHYNHYNTMYPTLDCGVPVGEITEHQESKAREFREDLLSYAKELSHELEAKGYEILEGFESVSYVEDAINGNEWKFTEDGAREHAL